LILLFAALFVLSALITLVVLRSGAEAAATVQRSEEGRPAASVGRIMGEFSAAGSGGAPGSRSGEMGRHDPLSVQDFILPSTVRPDSAGPYLLRPRLDRWGEQQVDRYWIPLDEIALDLLQRENDRRMEELFEDIP
jgi:hypothetical protein